MAGREGTSPPGAAERRGSAEALSEPMWRPAQNHAQQPAGAAAAGRDDDGAGAAAPPVDDVATPDFSGAVGGAAPPSGRSAPLAAPSITPLSPDMTNLSPIHMPSLSRRLIHVPPMPPLPDPAMAGAFFDGIALSPTGREAAEVLKDIALTGTKRPIDYDEGEGHEDELDDDYDEEGRSKKLRGSRCGTCANCLRPGASKFGGPNPTQL
jgi:hypothetical protein